MAKKRSEKKTSGTGPSPMDVSSSAAAPQPQGSHEPKDTSEGNVSNSSLKPISGKINKGVQVRRSKNLRKQKAIARAICNSEKYAEKASKNKNKMLRVHSAKTLYD